jgi:hypothetical protein
MNPELHDMEAAYLRKTPTPAKITGKGEALA